MAAELCNGLALFPGTDDADQLARICACRGPLPSRLQRLRADCVHVQNAALPTETAAVSETGVGNGSGSATVEGYLSPSSGLECESLSEKLPGLHPDLLALIESCLRLEPAERATAAELLEHPFFRGFASRFMPKLGEALRRDAAHYQAPSQGPSAYAEEGARSGVIIGGRTSQSSLVSPEMGRPVPLGANGAVWPTSDE